MRASRLLLMLLLLQNRGRMTAAELACELDVSRRTVLRDVEALGEAGSAGRRAPRRAGRVRARLQPPHPAHRAGERRGGGARGGALGPGARAGRARPGGCRRPARSKLVESLPDPVRGHLNRSRRQAGSRRSGAREPIRGCCPDGGRPAAAGRPPRRAVGEPGRAPSRRAGAPGGRLAVVDEREPDASCRRHGGDGQRLGAGVLAGAGGRPDPGPWPVGTRGCGSRVSDTCATSPSANDAISARVSSHGGPSTSGAPSSCTNWTASSSPPGASSARTPATARRAARGGGPAR